MIVLTIAFGFLPVLLLLAALIFLDSYKLVTLPRVLSLLLIGGAVAAVCFGINHALSLALGLTPQTYSRYIAPVIEESAKALGIAWLIRRHRVGFLVDTAILGFAIGTGFAVVENLYYLVQLPGAHPIVWLVRGCGTALMHGGATAIFGMVSKTLCDRADVPRIIAYLPGLGMAIVIHSLFNHFLLSPLLSTAGILLALPPVIFAVFQRSEMALAGWLNAGFDADAELLNLIESGEVSGSHVGAYLDSLQESFRGEVVADLLCYLRIYAELSLRAKGLLMMRESGFDVQVDDETRAKFREMEYLERSIGRTGKLAIAPFLHVKGKDLWQLYMLGK